ncbi:MAG: S1-like domain-containing RNA-binding protein [Alistipes sp.]|nr:S1-like domain-containing RNA-binding protein [Alistipes sp.]
MKVGQIQTLKVNRISDYGLYLIDEEGQEVLLPNRFVSLDNKEGDEIEVFVYHDSEDRLVATTDKPLITEGRCAALKVVDKNIHGVFLDWGISGKDLFLPNRNQQGGVLAGKKYIVWLYVDNITGRCVATMKLKPYVDNDIITVKPQQQVDILIASESPIG